MGRHRENLDVLKCSANGTVIPVTRADQEVSFVTLRGEIFYPGVNLFIGPLDGELVLFFGEKDTPYRLLKGDIVGIHYEPRKVISGVELGVQGG